VKEWFSVAVILFILLAAQPALGSVPRSGWVTITFDAPPEAGAFVRAFVLYDNGSWVPVAIWGREHAYGHLDVFVPNISRAQRMKVYLMVFEGPVVVAGDVMHNLWPYIELGVYRIPPDMPPDLWPDRGPLRDWNRSGYLGAHWRELFVPLRGWLGFADVSPIPPEIHVDLFRPELPLDWRDVDQLNLYMAMVECLWPEMEVDFGTLVEECGILFYADLPAGYTIADDYHSGNLANFFLTNGFKSMSADRANAALFTVNLAYFTFGETVIHSAVAPIPEDYDLLLIYDVNQKPDPAKRVNATVFRGNGTVVAELAPPPKNNGPAPLDNFVLLAFRPRNGSGFFFGYAGGTYIHVFSVYEYCNYEFEFYENGWAIDFRPAEWIANRSDFVYPFVYDPSYPLGVRILESKDRYAEKLEDETMAFPLTMRDTHPYGHTGFMKNVGKYNSHLALDFKGIITAWWVAEEPWSRDTLGVPRPRSWDELIAILEDPRNMYSAVAPKYHFVPVPNATIPLTLLATDPMQRHYRIYLPYDRYITENGTPEHTVFITNIAHGRDWYFFAAIKAPGVEGDLPVSIPGSEEFDAHQRDGRWRCLALTPTVPPWTGSAEGEDSGFAAEVDEALDSPYAIFALIAALATATVAGRRSKGL